LSAGGNVGLFLADALRDLSLKRSRKRETDAEISYRDKVRGEDLAYRSSRDAAADAQAATDRQRQNLMDTVNLAGGPQAVTLGGGDRVGPVAGGGMPGIGMLAGVLAQAQANKGMQRAGEIPGGPSVFVNPDRPQRLAAVAQERADSRQAEQVAAERTRLGGIADQLKLSGRDRVALTEFGQMPQERAPRAPTQAWALQDGVLLNRETGEIRPASVNGQPLSSVTGPKPATEGQTLAAGFARRMLDSMRILEGDGEEAGVETTGRPNGWQLAAGEMPLVGRRLQTAFMGSDSEQYRAAAENWIRANLRRESGANIPESEMDGEYRTYFPLPGEGPEVIKQKANLRRIATENMKQSAGSALSAGAPTRNPWR
jgi:hypothetical protein